jgi:glucosyl-dolichyl phosphate glucuronosyltransferase
MRVSICVCTYNRAKTLSCCLESLTKLKVPTGWEAEILVIDNNSGDDTKEIVHSFSRRARIAISYFHESWQGISAARNRAIKEASGDYLGFLDDECIVEPDWLEIIAADIEEFGPLIIGGPYTGVLLPGTVSPNWFRIEYGDAYFVANRFQRGYQKEFRASSGNMFLHRRVCEEQRFDPNLGPKGNEMKFGEETFLQNRFLSANPGTVVFYEPRIAVAHYILPHKISLYYHAKRQMELGACHYKVRSRTLPLAFARVLAYLCFFPFRVAIRDKSAYPYWQNYAYERAIPRVMPILGATLEKVRRRYPPF